MRGVKGGERGEVRVGVRAWVAEARVGVREGGEREGAGARAGGGRGGSGRARASYPPHTTIYAHLISGFSCCLSPTAAFLRAANVIVGHFLY